MNQHDTPLFSALVKHVERDPVQFHIPGHKGGLGINAEFRRFVGPRAFELDLINIAPLDDLHHPSGPIRAAQELAASAFGADHTYFSVQGTSTAIIAMIMCVVRPGDKILVPRNIHKSILTAIIITGAHPIFLQPYIDSNFGVAHGLSVETIREALLVHSDARALLVINPTYFGVAADLQQIVAVAHAAGVPVLVDEAHGTHTYFHERLPISAMAAGADIAATSVHKLGGSLVGSSMLHVREGFIDPAHVQVIMSMLTTTSTSYLLLSSLDVARRDLVLYGHERLDRTIQFANHARREINRIPGLSCMDERVLKDSATYDLDPTKLTVSVTGLGITGFYVERILREQFNIEVELSDLYNILCIVTMADTKENVNRLVHALEWISVTHLGWYNPQEIRVKVLPPTVLILTPRDAFYSRTETVTLSESVGRISAETIMVYPPGIPVLLPGEIVSQAAIDYIEENARAGLPVQGTDDPEIRNIRVVSSNI